MSAGPVTDVCQNCGAPLESDKDGRCPWCNARTRIEPPQSRYVTYLDYPAGLVPDDVDDCATSSPFLYLTLSVLGPGLSLEPAVQEYARRRPGLVQQIKAVSAAVSAAGVRVRDAGLLRDSFDENLKVYTPEEIWTFDLAIDVIAMLGTLDGLSSRARAMVIEGLRSLDDSGASHTWKKELKRAGEGPEAFRELRADVPRHTPSPRRLPRSG